MRGSFSTAETCSAALVGEGALADVGRVLVRGQVEALVQEPRDPRQLGQLVVADADLELGLQLQGGDQRDQVGVAAALAQPVERALNVAHPGANRGQRVGDGVAGIVVGVNAQVGAGNMLGHLADDPLDLVRQGAAVGIAEHDPAGTGLVGRLDAGQRIVGIGLVAIEEVLGIEHRLAPALAGQSNAIRDHLEVLRPLDPERDIDLEVPGLAEDAGRIGLGRENRGQGRIVGRRTPGAPCHAEGDEPCLGKGRRIGEEGVVGVIGPRPAAFDIVDAQIVQGFGYGDLVGHREVDALRLRAVAQRRVEEIRRRCRRDRRRSFHSSIASPRRNAGYSAHGRRQVNGGGRPVSMPYPSTGGQRAASSVAPKS